ncbi:MAG: TIGR04282 family arsenosugar biosynthesis glycosyltransferase [Firmicutes bacterium]|nr:TIGR04282 family arsenosugar biosynthesis glycosyltransferase [Bacillota bacterium]
MSSPALAIMTRVPSRQGKSRLSSILSPAQRESLQWAFFLDTLDKARQLPLYRCFVFATPSGQTGVLEKVTGSGVKVVPQVDGDLGQRILAAITYMYRLGHIPQVVIGTDSPALPAEYLSNTIQLLKAHDIVLGPALDGGYYLIGTKEPQAGLFTNIGWGTGSVLGKTKAACDKHRLSYCLLPSLPDIDRPEDLLELARHLKSTNNEALLLSPRTNNFLKSIKR